MSTLMDGLGPTALGVMAAAVEALAAGTGNPGILMRMGVVGGDLGGARFGIEMKLVEMEEMPEKREVAFEEAMWGALKETFRAGRREGEMNGVRVSGLSLNAWKFLATGMKDEMCAMEREMKRKMCWMALERLFEGHDELKRVILEFGVQGSGNVEGWWTGREYKRLCDMFDEEVEREKGEGGVTVAS